MANQSILIVDDDVELLTALTKILSKTGYIVAGATDSAAAMSYVTAGKQRFDLIVTDLSMPGINGLAFLSAVKASSPQVPVIVITAFGEWDTYAEAIRLGAFAYLNKPIDRHQLLNTIRRALQPAVSRPR
jgi:DNA-binding NtrC family response regulator